MKDLAIMTKTTLMSGDIHYFHFDNLRDCIEFINEFEELMKKPIINDDIESTSIEFSDGVNSITTLL